MMEISLSFVAWLSVLLIQGVVHVVVIYRRRTVEDHDEGYLIAEDNSSASETSCYNEEIKYLSYPDKELPSKLARINGDPALEEDCWDDFDDPPNLEHRLTQTGGEMMSVS